MPYDINSAPQRLEQNLNDLTSAREQVVNTVNASNKLLETVAEYVSSIETLCTRLRKWDFDLGERESSLSNEIGNIISQLTASCTQIVASFNNSVLETTSVFSNKTEAEISIFVEQNNKLAEHVQEMNALRDAIKNATEEIQYIKVTLQQISKDLKDSQDDQDAVLNEIKERVNAISTSTSEIIQTLANLNQRLDTGFNDIGTKADTISNDITNLTSLCQSIQSATTSLGNSLKESSSHLEGIINEAKESILKTENINRWIILAGIILLAILQFAFK